MEVVGVDSKLRFSESSPSPWPLASDLEGHGLKLKLVLSQDENNRGAQVTTWRAHVGKLPNPSDSDTARNTPLSSVLSHWDSRAYLLLQHQAVVS